MLCIKLQSLGQQRQLAFISEYTTNIEHVSGKLNVVADCLSRSSINKVSLGIDFVAMARAQIDSEEIQSYRTAITGLKLADMPVSNLGPVLLCERKSTQKLISEKFVWHGLKKEVTKWAKECI